MTNSPNGCVGVVGVGLMGSAVTRALLDYGSRIHVWNRTAARCTPLVSIGAIPHPTFPEMLCAVETFIILVSDYTVAENLLVKADLSGKLIICLSTGALGEAEDLAAKVVTAGGQYLDGTIQNYPDHVGSAEGLIITSGDRLAHDAAAPLLSRLGELRYAGPVASAANVFSLAYGAFICASIVAGLQAASLLENCGGDPAILFDVARRLRLNVEAPLSRIPTASDRATQPPNAAYADVASHLQAMELALITAKRMNVPMRLLEATREQLAAFGQSELRTCDIEQCYRLLAPAYER
jgi:3-hydroxyisobutyrate dehydrogenase-like beta-hydroxyacid dehydrogenase